jgi:hypothetical protein
MEKEKELELNPNAVVLRGEKETYWKCEALIDGEKTKWRRDKGVFGVPMWMVWDKDEKKYTHYKGGGNLDKISEVWESLENSYKEYRKFTCRHNSDEFKEHIKKQSPELDTEKIMDIVDEQLALIEGAPVAGHLIETELGADLNRNVMVTVVKEYLNHLNEIKSK